MGLIKGKYKFSDIVKVYEKSLCNVTVTCNKLGLNRVYFYNLLDRYPKFKQKIEQAREVQIDFVENAFMKLVEDNNPQAIIHYMKTVGKKRGYNENNNLNLTIQPYNPNTIDFEQRKALIADTVKALEQTNSTMIQEATETTFTEVLE
jgi:hypothetical protein